MSKGSDRRLLRDLLVAADNYAFRGAGYPEDIEDIEEEYLRSLNKMEERLGLNKSNKLPVWA